MRRTTDVLRPCRCITCRQDVNPRAILLAAVALLGFVWVLGKVTGWGW